MFLMHKNTPVALLDSSGHSIKKVFDKTILPVGVYSEYPQLQNNLFSSWKKMRAIPHNRQNYTRLTEKLGFDISPECFDSMKVSLTDTYWFFPNVSYDKDFKIKWEDINFHDNEFCEDIAKYSLLDKDFVKTIFSTNSPELTTDGMLTKGWLSLNSAPTLIKLGILGNNCSNKHLLSANEVVASSVARLMGIDCVSYSPLKIDGDVVCSCPCFVTNSNTDFINALQLQHSENVYGVNFYNYFKKIGMEQDINNMIILDTLLHNNDRHEKNFGVLRDADSLEIQNFAPLFDNGSCLGWDFYNNVCENDMKPFLDNRKKQLLLINKVIELPNKEDIVNIIQDVYEQYSLDEYNFRIAKKEIDTSYHLIYEHNKEKCPAVKIKNTYYNNDFYER